MEPRIRPMGRDDLPFAVAAAAREGWPTVAALFEVYLAHDPEGCFVAEIGGAAAGMVTSTRYRRTGWIGNVIVEPPFRRRGLGERLTRHALDRLAGEGVATVRLEADPPGVGIYHRLGFADEVRSLRFRRDGSSALPPTTARPLSPADRETVADFDATHFGDDGSRLLDLLVAWARAGYVLERGGELAGYALATPVRRGTRIGPCIAVDPPAAAELFGALLRHGLTGEVSLGVVEANADGCALLAGLGFAPTPGSRRMVWGKGEGAGSPAQLFAIADGALG